MGGQALCQLQGNLSLLKDNDVPFLDNTVVEMTTPFGKLSRPTLERILPLHCSRQRLSEYLQYSEVLDLAAIQPEPMYRIALRSPFPRYPPTGIVFLSLLILCCWRLLSYKKMMFVSWPSRSPIILRSLPSMRKTNISLSKAPSDPNKLVCIPGASYKVTLKKVE